MTRKKRQRKDSAQEQIRQIDRLLPTLDQELPDDLMDPELLGFPSDPRAMERMTASVTRLLEKHQVEDDQLDTFMSDLMFSGGGSLEDAPPPVTPLEKAQDVMYDAFESEDSQKRVRLAKKALKISPDCADAYVVLAEETAKDPAEARKFYEDGVKAGERALGEEFFTEEAGNFWHILESRPYMRAREGLAAALWALGEHEEAIAQYRQMLELNPNDNQGIRNILLGFLQFEGRNDEMGELFGQYEEDASALWLYTRALWRFRTEGASKKATTDLIDATKTNPHVPLYLLGRKSFMALALREPPELMGDGEETEAVSYFAAAIAEWLKTPGAIDWVRDNVDEKALARLESKGL